MKIFLLVVTLLLGHFSISQQIHPSLLEVEVTSKNFHKGGKQNVGFTLLYLKGTNNHIDWQITFSGSFPDSISENKHTESKQSFLFQNDFSLRYRFISTPLSNLQPFIKGGLGYSLFRSDFGTYVPLGGGIQCRLKQIYFLLQSHYAVSIHQNINSHFNIGFGIAGSLSNPKKKGKSKPVGISSVEQFGDKDGDGIYDHTDACPTVAGIIKFNGCPDSDNDGIQDKEDNCPLIFGFEKYLGCPIPDTDKDGINDEEDLCVEIPGIKEYNGCPVPDTDGDGTNDLVDKCKSVKGPISNNGCPIDSTKIQKSFNEYAKAIYFETGKTQLLPASFPALDSIVSLLINNLEINLSIEGHTDNVGKIADNVKLSQARAKAVFEYLSDKKINPTRLKSIGFGSKRPIADNNKSNGRALNRRVELILMLY